MTTTVFGVRHHGPGSARSLVEDLKRLEPDCILVEGPPDANALIPLAADKEMRPPVALLVYDPEHPHDAGFFPFAVFSPEWQAIRHGLAAGVPVRFIDLAVGIQLARARAERERRLAELAGEGGGDGDGGKEPGPAETNDGAEPEPEEPEPDEPNAPDEPEDAGPNVPDASGPDAEMDTEPEAGPADLPIFRSDPLGELARAAG
jgi:hypothetical protein